MTFKQCNTLSTKPECLPKPTTTNFPFVTVIVPTYHEWYRLRMCIDALSKQSYPKDRYEVLIVNNDPDDTPPADMTMPENFHLLNERKPGSYAARNKALSHARGEIIGFTDADCVPDPKWIYNAVAHLKAHPSCSRVAGKIAIEYKGEKPSPSELYNEMFAFPQRYHVDKTGTSVTANLFTYKKVMDSVGWFDAEVFSCSDLAWGRQASKAGYSIDYVDSVQVKHPARNFVELSKKERRVGGSQGMRYRGKGPKFVLERTWNLINGMRPRIDEIKFVWKMGKHLSFKQKLDVLWIRHYMLNVRLYESIKVNLGKDQSRT